MNLHRRLWITSMAAGGLASVTRRMAYPGRTLRTIVDGLSALSFYRPSGRDTFTNCVRFSRTACGWGLGGGVTSCLWPTRRRPVKPQGRSARSNRCSPQAVHHQSRRRRHLVAGRFPGIRHVSSKPNDAKADLGIIPGRCGPEAFLRASQSRPRAVGHLEPYLVARGRWSAESLSPAVRRAVSQSGKWPDRKVLEETGITMRGFCGGGIKYQGQPVHDQEDATHWIVRNHADYRVHFTRMRLLRIVATDRSIPTASSCPGGSPGLRTKDSARRNHRPWSPNSASGGPTSTGIV